MDVNVEWERGVTSILLQPKDYDIFWQQENIPVSFQKNNINMDIFTEYCNCTYFKEWYLKSIGLPTTASEKKAT